MKLLKEWDLAEAHADSEMQRQAYSKIRDKFAQFFAQVESAFASIAVSTTSPDAKPAVLRVEKSDYIIGDDRYITLGRIVYSDVAVRDNAVKRPSRLHACVRRFGEFVVLLDVGSFSALLLPHAAIEARHSRNQWRASGGL